MFRRKSSLWNKSLTNYNNYRGARRNRLVTTYKDQVWDTTRMRASCAIETLIWIPRRLAERMGKTRCGERIVELAQHEHWIEWIVFRRMLGGQKETNRDK